MATRLLTVLADVTAVLGAGPVWAQHGSPQPVLPELLKWAGPPNMPQLKVAWVLGADKEPATYALPVMLAKGGRISVHTHPDTRNSAVLSGTLCVGFGDDFDESKMVAVLAGGVYVAPAGVPHYLMARDDDVVYREAGVGPTATVMLKK